MMFNTVTQRLLLLVSVMPSMLLANSLHEQYVQLLDDPEQQLSCFEPDSYYQYCLKNIPHQGLFVIDKQGNKVYQPYYFDNWPDEAKDGVYRIRQGNRIGFADEKTGNIVIEAKYDCAYPFENGKANVGTGCQLETDGEHSWWVGGDWVSIDTHGHVITSSEKP